MNADERWMKGMAMVAGIIASVVSTATVAQPRYDDNDPPEYRERRDEREAYRRGYERGFERGYEKGMQEGRRTSAPPPPVVAPPRIGPIRVTGAAYGTSSRSCDATRFVAGRANGKMSFSFEVTNGMCGDPARGDRKELQVTYRCGDIVKTSSANEHRTIYMSCNSP